MAALTSCLDRYASGYELKDGEKWPPKATKDTFNQRMARWFFFRPYLGVVMGPVFTWGTDILVKDASSLTNSATHLGFAAFVGGLLAKSIIDVIKGVFKNIFKS